MEWRVFHVKHSERPLEQWTLGWHAGAAGDRVRDSPDPTESLYPYPVRFGGRHHLESKLRHAFG